MEYLNNFTPSSLSLEEAQSSNEFTRAVILETFIDLKAKHPEIKGVDLSFDPDRIVFDGPEVVIEFYDSNVDTPKLVKFDALQLTEEDQPSFTALEIFQKILSFEDKLNGGPCFFKEIRYVKDISWGGRLIPHYKVEFGLTY